MMKQLVAFLILVHTVFAFTQEENSGEKAFQAPIPVEVMAGNNYTLYQMTVSKQVTPGNKFGFFNLMSYEVDYEEITPDVYFVQTAFTYNIANNFKVGAGSNVKTFGGFKPIIWSSYSKFNENIGFIVQPTFELGKNGVSELFSLFEWHPTNDKKIQPYFRVQALLGFNKAHVFSYHYWRVGIQYKMFRFGPALNVQYVGEKAVNNTNYGGFINVLIN